MTRAAGGRAEGEATSTESDEPGTTEGNEEAKYAISFHRTFDILFPGSTVVSLYRECLKL
jgi:hypothetical protein